MPKERIILDKDLLYRLYVEEKRGCKYIAKKCGCNKNTVRAKLIRYGIPIRSAEESKTFRGGHLSSRWRGGVTPENKKIRFSKEYKSWREAVFQRDDWTCVFCGQRGGNIQADHIKQFALFPEERLNVDNGRTLCVRCHRDVTSQQMSQKRARKCAVQNKDDNK